MESMHFVGLDIHKKTVSYCVKKVDGSLVSEGKIPATMAALSEWSRSLPKPWSAAMEATIFSGWIYDLLLPEASEVKVAHPLMLRAISAAKKKNDRLDAGRICDLLRCDLLPECRMASTRTRDLRRVLRYRNLVVRQAVSIKNRMSGLLMETGISYESSKLHRKRYFENLLEELRREREDSLPQLLGLSRATVTALMSMEHTLIRQLLRDDELHGRVLRLMTIPAVGPVTALTWALEIGDVSRFRSLKQVISYAGLSADECSSGEKQYRMPLSKKCNKHLKTVLIEAARIAPYWNPELNEIYQRECERGNRNRAALAVARKIAGYLLAVDRRGSNFVVNRTATEQPAA
jgi:transposase